METENSPKFEIDLNEEPLPSPRDVLVFCCDCDNFFQLPASVINKFKGDWKCSECLSKNERSGGGGVGLLDINATPPREEDEFDQDKARNGAKMQAVHDTSFVGHSFDAPVTYPNLLYLEKGFKFHKSSSNMTHVADLGFRVPMQHRPNFDSSPRETGPSSTFQGRLWASHYAPLKILSQGPNEVYLQELREFIFKKKGVLGGGWHVEFDYCQRRCKTYAVYYAPDGRRFESMYDVARHLGLLSNCHSLKTEERGDEFGLLQKGSHGNRRRKEASRSLRASHRMPIEASKFSNSRSAIELDPVENGGCGSPFNDGFPIQFEDFLIISIGKVDPRPSYHSTCQIWPVGYRSSWHDKITGSLFVCDVLDGGDSGPMFKVRRCPCTMLSIPNGSTIVSRTHSGKHKVEKDDSAIFGMVDDENTSIFGMVDDENTSIQMMLAEYNPPLLDNDIFSCFRKISNEDFDFQKLKSDCLPPRSGYIISDNLGQGDSIGEFSMEGRSSSSVWEMVSRTLLHACREAYKQTGVLQFFCKHDVGGRNVKAVDTFDSLSMFCYSAGPINIPYIIQSDNEFDTTCEMLVKWLQQDRSGLDLEFVQELLEQLPGVDACSGYKLLNNRSQGSTLQTVGSGFLRFKTKSDVQCVKESSNFIHSKRPKKDLTDCPSGKPLSSKLPAYLIGDVLQAWEFLQRFSEVLGMEKAFSLHELECEFVNPWLDSVNPQRKPANVIPDIGEGTSCKSNIIEDHSLFPSGATASTVPSGNHWSPVPIEPESAGEVAQAKMALHTHRRCTGVILTEVHSSLMKVLGGELLLKVAAYVDPNFDVGESKSRRGRKKDGDNPVTGKKTKLDILPLNELTWPEISRRYILAVLSMEGNLDSAEITCRESGRVFHCLQGDGGELCGCLTGVSAMEEDALFLAEAKNRIFGSLKKKDEILSINRKESDAVGTSKIIKVDDSELPEWAQALEPVRKLPTNVGARIRRCVFEALGKNPPEWAKKILEYSISKEVYKGNASGPTKRAVVSVLADVSHESLFPKPEKKQKEKEKEKKVQTVSDLIMKQCRIVLRNVAAADEERVFCNLLGRTVLNPNDNDDEGLLGYPAMVSRPLDFRTIDLRLTAGAYAGSHEAFAEDVREVWHNIRMAYCDRSDLFDLAETLSEKFEDLYKKEVLTLVQKAVDCVDPNCLSEEERKDIEDILARASESSLPKAPWDGVCKVCGMDKDDDNVLLCDICDSEYHTYCLNPPLLRIPEGNWYCPSCVAGQSTSRVESCGTRVISRCGKRRYRGELVQNYLEGLAKLANTMESKEYWEFSVEERIFLFKFLCDEALNSTIIRDQLDQCASLSADLQQKHRSLTSECKILIFKEEIQAANLAKGRMNVYNGGGELGLDSSASMLSNDGTRGSRCVPDNLNAQQESNHGGCNGLMLSTTQVTPDHISLDTTGTNKAENVPTTNVNVSQSSKIKGSSLKNEISCLQDSIASLESELSKVYVRKELLGRDSVGQKYWVFGGPGTSPGVVVCKYDEQRDLSENNLNSRYSSTSELYPSQQNIGIPNCSSWTCYQSDAEIEELVGWLTDDDAREGALRESILRWRRNKSKETNDAGNHSLKSSNDGEALDSDFPVTKAVATLEKKYNSCLETQANLPLKNGRVYSCECLEPLWPSRPHCLSCHQTFSSSEDLEGHNNGNCIAVSTLPEVTSVNEDSLNLVNRTENLLENSEDITIVTASKSENQGNRSRFDKCQNNRDCPFDFEEIRAKFVTENSLRDLVKDIGLIGNNGNPSFVSAISPHLSDPALSLLNTIKREVNPRDTSTDLENQQQRSSNSAENGIDEEVSKVERSKSKGMSGKDRFSSVNKRSPVTRMANYHVTHGSSLRPLVGRVSGILRWLKKNLLDMDAALPEESLRPSRADPEKRCAWRAFVKSAESIYKMSLATIILEDMIKADYLRKFWWYWSTPSAVANISTLSALALRIYTLDAAIIYDKPSSNKLATEMSKSGHKSDKGFHPNSNPGKTHKSSSPSETKSSNSSPAENSNPKSRASKRKKVSGG